MMQETKKSDIKLFIAINIVLDNFNAYQALFHNAGVCLLNVLFTMQVHAYRLVCVSSFPQKTLDHIDVSILRRGMERCPSLVGYCIHIKTLVHQVVCNTVVAAEKKMLLLCVINKT